MANEAPEASQESAQTPQGRPGPYVDSGVLIKLYVLEPNSAGAARMVGAFPSVNLYPFQELEVRNTLQALEGRASITAAQRAAAEHEFERDVVLGRLRRAIPDWSEVFKTAMRLSSEHGAATLARSLDIIHVAIAITVQAEPFITGDHRQRSVAQREGLSTEMLE
ncbi:MAG: type II toxin-antitoxin system VapC family toxin [Spirochaetaceae bacterium]|nr:type II toxin-antitoxin system VapC family toxin [Spirochaetaceae bacterium]